MNREILTKEELNRRQSRMIGSIKGTRKEYYQQARQDFEKQFDAFLSKFGKGDPNINKSEEEKFVNKFKKVSGSHGDVEDLNLFK